MKLLRLTSEDITGLYKSDFNSHLEIKPYSKIALQSVSAGAYPIRLDVDINNNELFVQWGDSDYTRDTVNLDLVSYNSGNYRDLLDDIQNKCNEVTKFDSGVTNSSQNNKTLGLEWAAYLDSTKHVNIGYKTGATKEYESEWEQTGTIVRSPLGVWANNGASTPAVNNYIGFPQYISRGCGSIHCRINNIGVTSGQGFAIGLTRDYLALQNNTFNIKDLDYGLTVYSPANSGLLQYGNIVKGEIFAQLTPVGFLGVGNVNNDSMQVRINGKYIEFNVYNEVGGKLPFTTGHDEVYTTGEQLYPVCIFFGEQTDTSLSFLRITPSPYFPSASNLLSTELLNEGIGLGAPPKPIAGVKSKNYINFLSAELSTFLGFNSMRRPQSGVFDVVFPTFVAERAFNTPEFADTYMIQMLNLSVESYDSYSKNNQGGQRQNILAVLPSTSTTGSFVYEPSYPTFLDLDNKEHISLRNLKMRIIYGDYSPIAAKGVGSIILMIKDKDE